jgi:hypothetical protein
MPPWAHTAPERFAPSRRSNGPLLGLGDRDADCLKKYLEPTFQCDVETVRSAAGNDHPMVIVDSAALPSRTWRPDAKS